MCAVKAQAGSAPFKAPFGTQVSVYSTGNSYSVWTVNAPDGSATAVVGKTKLPRQYWNNSAFQRYVNSYFKDNQTFAAYGIKYTASWKNGAYTIAGTSNGYRVYGKGSLSDTGVWLYGWVVGQSGSEYTTSLERMIRALK